jgi:hypothetical protein
MITFVNKNLILPLAIGIAVLIGFFLHRKRELKNSYLKSTGFKPSISKAVALNYANTLENALKGWGTRERSIEAVVDACTPGDWALVNDLYGVRWLKTLYTHLDKDLSLKKDKRLRVKIASLYKPLGFNFDF